MKIKFTRVLLIAVLTTIIALIASLIALPDNSGYAGLFFISISPIFIVVFIIWTYILLSAFSKQKKMSKTALFFLTTFLFEYLVVATVMLIMSSDNPNYNLQDFLSDAGSMLCDKGVFFCILSTSAIYSLLLNVVRTSSLQQTDL